MWHACTQHTHSHTPGRMIELPVDCRATLLSSPTDECGLCRAMAIALPINQRQLRLLRATVGRAFIVNDKAFGLGSARLDSARLGLAWLGLQGCFFVLLPCAMCFVVDLGTQQQQQQQLCNKRRRPHGNGCIGSCSTIFWLDSSFFFCSLCCVVPVLHFNDKLLHLQEATCLCGMFVYRCMRVCVCV